MRGCCNADRGAERVSDSCGRVFGGSQGLFKGFGGHNIVSEISKLSVRLARKLRRCKIVVLVEIIRFPSADGIEKIRITGRAGGKCRVGVAFHFF